MRYAALVAASYILVLSCEALLEPGPSNLYYLSLLATTTVVIFLCSLRVDKITFIYALLQFAMGASYMVLLAAHEYPQLAVYGFGFLYDYPVNLKDVVFTYEIAMLACGGLDAYHAITRRWPHWRFGTDTA